MKLVTGIEAIQSGKPWKHKDDTGWIDNDTLVHIMPRHVLEKIWVIKEEPREFWIFTPSSGDMFVYTGDYKGADFSGDNWIRVREIEK